MTEFERESLVWETCERADQMARLLSRFASEGEQLRVALAMHRRGSNHDSGYPEIQVCDLVREIVGNPFKRNISYQTSYNGDAGVAETKLCVAGPPHRLPGLTLTASKWEPVGWLEWRDGMIVKAARHVRDGLQWDQLSVLADMLEEAGCSEHTILNHLRGMEKCPWCDGIGSSAPQKLEATSRIGGQQKFIDGMVDKCSHCEGKGNRKVAAHCSDCWAVRLLSGCNHYWRDFTSRRHRATQVWLCRLCNASTAIDPDAAPLGKPYMLIGGTVTARDGDMHYISPHRLKDIYGIDIHEPCVMARDDNDPVLLGRKLADYIVLRPQFHYSLMEIPRGVRS